MTALARARELLKRAAIAPDRISLHPTDVTAICTALIAAEERARELERALPMAALAAAERAYAAAVAEERAVWIPVSERLPETGQLICYIRQQSAADRSDGFDMTSWTMTQYDGHGLLHATCWMPLPEPPIIRERGDKP